MAEPFTPDPELPEADAVADAMDALATARIDRKKPAAAQVYEQLRGLIIALAVPPGATLARGTLAERFGISQTPVREALLRLEEEGLVDIYPQAATRVSKIDLQSVREAQFLRISVELEVVRRLASGAGQLDLHELEALLAKQTDCLARGDIPAFAEADRDFHKAMCMQAEVPGLWAVVRTRSGHLDRLRHLHLPTPGKAQSVIEEHTRILRAIAAGQPEEAQRQLRQHLSSTLASVEALRREHPSYLKD